MGDPKRQRQRPRQHQREAQMELDGDGDGDRETETERQLQKKTEADTPDTGEDKDRERERFPVLNHRRDALACDPSPLPSAAVCRRRTCNETTARPSGQSWSEGRAQTRTAGQRAKPLPQTNTRCPAWRERAIKWRYGDDGRTEPRQSGRGRGSDTRVENVTAGANVNMESFLTLKTPHRDGKSVRASVEYGTRRDGIIFSLRHFHVYLLDTRQERPNIQGQRAL